MKTHSSNASEHPGYYGSHENRRAAAPAVLLLAASYLLGGAGLVLWVGFLASGALGIVRLGMGPTNALLFDALLSLIFFAQHSLMVRASFKEWMARRISRDFHGALYAAASGVALLVLAVLWQGPVYPRVVLNGVPRLLVTLASFLALPGFIWGVRSLGSFDMFGSASLLRFMRAAPSPEPMPLTVRGAYRWVRHPLYFFCLVAIWAVSEITVDRLLYNVIWTGWIVLGAALEERDLVAAFGTAYRDYQKRVPMLIPWRIRPTRWAPSHSLARPLCDRQSAN